ncbi:MAG: ArsC family transcriptional regulator [Candidatus Aureabacteria bacterium]|nr:ArsC family transcriptional regulator [Candidatus Auribacterota bacterium]
MSWQIFGTKKCRNTQKTERYFKERRIPYQFVNLMEKAISYGELEKIMKAVPLEELLDKQSKEYEKLNLKYMLFDPFQTLLEYPLLFKTPIVRMGMNASCGYQPQIWEKWKK